MPTAKSATASLADRLLPSVFWTHHHCWCYFFSELPPPPGFGGVIRSERVNPALGFVVLGLMMIGLGGLLPLIFLILIPFAR
jgi:hypothetical protein